MMAMMDRFKPILYIDFTDGPITMVPAMKPLFFSFQILLSVG
jgi:hypothetical protein